LILAFHNGACWYMGNTHCRVSFIDMLPTWAWCAKGVDA
jgi:hypothetical protein